MSFTVLITDYAWPDLRIEREILAGCDAQLVVAESGEADELVELAPQADAILTNWKRVPEEALEEARRCLVVSRYGVGLDNIPVTRATELGILVTNVPDFCVDEVSDHALALLLACARRLVAFDRSTAAGAWNHEFARGLPRLREQVVGLVGYGKIAKAFARKARACGLTVVAYTPRINHAEQNGITATNQLSELLSMSDYVSLHAPATPETVSLIGEPELRAMKANAYLINTSRGALVDEVALRRALDERWIAGAALDVLVQEPPAPTHPLTGHERALITPHVAFYSDSSIEEVEMRAATNVAEVLAGRLPRSIANPEVVHRQSFRLAGRDATLRSDCS